MMRIVEAINALRPNTEWLMNGDDVEGIMWHTEGVEPLTTAEVQAEIARLEKAAAQAEADREAAKASALAKLEALGLTHDEALAITGL